MFNTVRRSGSQGLPRLARQYVVPAAQQAEEQGRMVKYLQEEDGRLLHDVSNQMQQAIDQANLCIRNTQALQTTVQLLPDVPPYTVSALRSLIPEATAFGKRYVSRAETLIEHLDDFLVEPYPVVGQSNETDHEDEMWTWDRERLEGEAENLAFEIAAQENRLKTSTEQLREAAAKLGAFTEERMRAAEVKDAGRREDPFATAVLPESKPRAEERKVGFGKEGVRDAGSKILPKASGPTTWKPDFMKPKSVSAVVEKPAKSPSSLLEMQAELEKALRTTK